MVKIKFNRRNFIKNSILATGAVIADPLTAASAVSSQKIRFSDQNLNASLAISMWDYSWLLRHHRNGEFENWEKVLDELLERGYNAIRLDIFPHLVAADKNGNISEEFFHIRESWKPSYWGNQFSMYSRPREALIEFIKLCIERNIYLGLSTWLMPHGTTRNIDITGIDGFVRVWNETLTFLDNHNLLRNILYVDLLNEFPLWHGFEWFKKEMNIRGNSELFRENNPDANVPDEAFLKGKELQYNTMQLEFINGFISQTIKQMKHKWPELLFFASQPGATSWQQMDYSEFDAIDVHFWFSHNKEFNTHTGVSGLNLFRSEEDRYFKENYKKVTDYWYKNKKELSIWMEGRIAAVGLLGRELNIPVGNTEGWGAVFWQDHPLTDWSFIKDAGNVAVELAIKHNYKFICTSNFTHPQFNGIWKDVGWHQQLTRKIKEGK